MGVERALGSDFISGFREPALPVLSSSNELPGGTEHSGTWCVPLVSMGKHRAKHM